MADTEDKEKAEKVAAARKRYEALKKQKAKKAAGKKESDTTTTTTTTTTNESTDAPKTTDAAGESTVDPTEGKDADEIGETAVEEGKELATSLLEPPRNGRQESTEAAESQLRSESFRRGEMNTGPLSPSIEGDAVQDIYRKQIARIEQLEKDNKRLESELDERQRALAKSEREVEELQDAQGGVAELKSKAAKYEENAEENSKLKADVASLQRQNAHLQSAAAKRRTSIASPPTDDLVSQLASKTSALEALELEISNLRHSLTTSASRIEELEASLTNAQSVAHSSMTELTTLRATLTSQAAASSSAKDTTATPSTTSSDPRITLLESDLRSANLSAQTATSRASALEAKIATLTTLHRDTEARRARDAEKAAADTAQLRRQLAGGDDAAGMDELEDEERRALSARVRELEGQVFELKRGAWRDQRAGYDGDEAQWFDDVDLNTPGGALRRASRSTLGAGAAMASSANPYISAVADGISNVFSVLTSPTRGPASYFPQQQAQMQTQRQEGGGGGRVDGYAEPGDKEVDEEEEEEEFDEDAFRLAQEDAARERLERVRETKRGLERWRGWRLDLVEARGGFGAVVVDV